MRVKALMDDVRFFPMGDVEFMGVPFDSRGGSLGVTGAVRDVKCNRGDGCLRGSTSRHERKQEVSADLFAGTNFQEHR